jgi:hypothetical protein
MNTILKSVLCAWLLGTASAQAQILIQVSIKLILDANGNRPPNQPGFQLATPAEIQSAVDIANAVLLTTGRGYQLDADILEVSGISQYFDATPTEGNRDRLERDAKNETVRYRWRAGVINVYVSGTTDGGNSGICSFPGGTETILLSQRGGGTTLLHELGHFFGLYHTQGRSCGGCDSCGGVLDDRSDHVDDTLKDWACWDQDEIASNNGMCCRYEDLLVENQVRVDNVFFNVMSYHDTRNRLTSGQMDRLTDFANGSRNWAVTGDTEFVDFRNDALFPDGSSEKAPFTGTGGPYPTVAQGVLAASASDIVLIRAGTYEEGLLIRRPLTLRASRGDAILR